MKITKVGKEKVPGMYLPYYISEPLSGDTDKMKKRYEIESKISDDVYDIYDMFADLANAFNELTTGVTDGPAITKWNERQLQITEILGK